MSARAAATQAKISTAVKAAVKEATDTQGMIKIVIAAPNFKTAPFQIRGTAPYVQCKFSQKAKDQIIATQMAGSQARSKRTREAKDFEAAYRGAMHLSTEGWHGIPASSFRNAMISACRCAGYAMTRAKLAAFIEADGVDAENMPLVRIVGEPHQHTTYARNANGSIDMRVRPMWDKWTAEVRVHFDADMLGPTDIANLLMRAGVQVGIGEGRPDSRESNGLGWGLFEIVADILPPTPNIPRSRRPSRVK